MTSQVQKELSILHLEDDARDAELIRETLKDQGIFANMISVETEMEFRATLKNGGVDLVLSDYSLPGFGGMRALQIVRETSPDLPFIFVSGTIGEDIAIESLKNGATDYVLKQGLQRLGLSVQRALTEVKEREQSGRKDEALRNSEARYKLLFDSNPLPMWVFSLETLAFLAVNEAAIHHYGYSREEFRQMKVTDIRPSQDVPALMKDLAETRKGYDRSGTWRHQKKDGTIIYVEITSHGLEFLDQQAEIVLANDITEQRQALNALCESEERLQTVIENLTEGLIISDLDGQLIHWNRTALEMLGFATMEECLLRLPEFETIFELSTLDGSHIKLDEWPLSRIIRGEQLRDFEICIRRIGSDWERIFSYGGAIVREPSGRRVAFVTITDISERKRAEKELILKNQELAAMTQQLWQASKLATMGELAASIAHELNNPLATVSLRAESLLGQLDETDPKRPALEVISQEVERMGNLVGNLLAFSRRSHQQISTIDLREELSSSLDLIHYHLRSHRIDIVKDFAHTLPTIQADRQQLRQVFLNLLTNASDAMPNGGVITVRAEPAILDDKDALLIEISDTGTGIDEADLPKLWEPFFTTKAEGKGTGLGLAICRRTIEEHKGTISISSVIGAGTTVSIFLPATTRDVPQT